MDDNAYLNTIKDINWDTFYQQKMALESLTDYLHRNKEQENGMFGRAAAWMEGILTMMDGFTDAAADENAFSYPARDENDRHLGNGGLILDAPDDLETVFARHFHIQQDALQVQKRQLWESFLAAEKDVHGKMILQNFSKKLLLETTVVNNGNVFAWGRH